MNKKRKILTVAAMVVFGAIIYLHSIGWFHNYRFTAAFTFNPRYCDDPIIRDIRTPLFVLAVFYVGMFSLLGETRIKRRKRLRARKPRTRKLRAELPQRAQWQHIGNQLNAAMIFAEPIVANL